MKLLKSFKSIILAGLFVLIAMAATATPYARVELDYFDQYNADMKITLWSDSQCTVPYTPPANTSLYVEVTNNWVIYNDYNLNWQTPVVEGFYLNSHSNYIKQVNMLRWYTTQDPDYGEITEWVWSNYGVTSDGTGNYIPSNTFSH